MSNFIDQADYYTYVEERRLNQILDGNNNLLDNAELTAETIIRDSLFQYYKVDDIFNLTAAARPMQVVRWMIVLSVYFLYERVPDSATPQRITDNYKDVTKLLREIELGKRSINLESKLKIDNTSPETRFTWGSNPKRSH